MPVGGGTCFLLDASHIRHLLLPAPTLATSPKAESFFDMTVSHIHQLVPLKLLGLKPRDKFTSISVLQLTRTSKQRTLTPLTGLQPCKKRWPATRILQKPPNQRQRRGDYRGICWFCLHSIHPFWSLTWGLPLGNQPSSTICILGRAVSQGVQLSPGQRMGP